MGHSERVQTDDLVRDDADEPMTRDASTQLEPLFADDRATELRGRWQMLQSRFVDDPRDTVEEADALVAELLQELARSFSDARSTLERQWTEGDDVSTEDLRVTLQRYRSFFERLLAV
jgi:ketosteroid isomerase-like protein